MSSEICDGRAAGIPHPFEYGICPIEGIVVLLATANFVVGRQPFDSGLRPGVVGKSVAVLQAVRPRESSLAWLPPPGAGGLCPGFCCQPGGLVVAC